MRETLAMLASDLQARLSTQRGMSSFQATTLRQFGEVLARAGGGRRCAATKPTPSAALPPLREALKLLLLLRSPWPLWLGRARARSETLPWVRGCCCVDTAGFLARARSDDPRPLSLAVDSLLMVLCSRSGDLTAPLSTARSTRSNARSVVSSRASSFAMA